MSSIVGGRRAERCLECSDSHLLWDPKPVNEMSHSALQWTDRRECKRQREILREQLQEMDEHVTRLQDTLEHEKAKYKRLQLRSNQQGAALRRQEQQINRLKERLSVRPRDKGPSIEVLNIPPGGRVKGEQPVKSLRSAARQEEAVLRLVLERREAELREAMKLRHRLTTLLHALRVNMEHTLSGGAAVHYDVRTESKCLAQAEASLGDHVTGGVVHRWRQVQRKLEDLLSEGQTAVGPEHHKLLARLESDLKESQQLVRLQQQLLQDSLASPVPSELADSYFLEEWQRLQLHWAEFRHQRRTFERERQSFTEAAIRLSRERCDFEQQKASLLKQQYLSDSPHLSNGRRDGTEVGCCPQLEQTRVFGRLHTTPSPKSGAAHELHQEGVGAQTPDTPELYSALNLSYNSRSKSCGLLIRLHSSVLLQKQWDRGSVRIVGQSLSSEAVGFQTFSALQLPSR